MCVCVCVLLLLLDLDGGFTEWSGIQMAQDTVYTLVENTGMVTASDQGCCSLHYPHKVVVSDRAHLWLRKLAFGDTTVTPEVCNQYSQIVFFF